MVKFGTSNYYIGDFKDNEKNGFGYHHFINGLVYKGKYENGIKVDGVVIDPSDNRIVFTGDWKNDNYNGNGLLRRKNGDTYDG